MWRNEVGCFEMLTSYFVEHEEQLRPGRSRRDFLLEILHTHEMSRLGFRDDDVIMLPYNEQSQSFYVFDRSMSKTLQLQNLNEPPPLVRSRNSYWPYRDPPRSFRPQNMAPNGAPKTAIPGDGRQLVDMDEDITVTAACHGEVTTLPPPRVERLLTPPPSNDVVVLSASFPPMEAPSKSKTPPPADHLRLPTDHSPSRESGGAPAEAAVRRRPKKRRNQRSIRCLHSTLELLEAGGPTEAATRPRRQSTAGINYSLVRRRRRRTGPREEAGPQEEGAVPQRKAGPQEEEAVPQRKGGPGRKRRKRRGRPPGAGWSSKKQKQQQQEQEQQQQAATPPRAPFSFVLLPKEEVELEEAQSEDAQLTPSSVRKSSRLVGHQNPILKHLKRRGYRKRREENAELSELSNAAPSAPPARRLHPCPVCTRPFKYKGALAHHMRRHPSKRFQCSVCLKRFTTKAYCKSHERRHAEGPPLQRCRFCGAQFGDKVERQEHEMRAHIAAL